MALILYNSLFNIELHQDLNATKMAVEKSGNYVELYVDKLKVISNILVNNNETINYLSESKNIEAEKNLNGLLNHVGAKDYVFILNNKNEIVYHKDTNYFTNKGLQNNLIAYYYNIPIYNSL